MDQQLPPSLRLAKTEPGASKQEILLSRLETAGTAYMQIRDIEALTVAIDMAIEADVADIEITIPEYAKWSESDQDECEQIKQAYIMKVSDALVRLFIDNKAMLLSMRCAIAAGILADWRHILAEQLRIVIKNKAARRERLPK